MSSLVAHTRTRLHLGLILDVERLARAFLGLRSSSFLWIDVCRVRFTRPPFFAVKAAVGYPHRKQGQKLVI